MTTKVTFAHRWFFPTSETSREEYPAGSSAELDAERLKAAREAKVLADEPPASPADKKPAED